MQKMMAQYLDHVGKIISTVKSNPVNMTIAKESWDHHELNKLHNVDSKVSILMKIHALTLEEGDRVRSMRMTRDIELTEVEFPNEAMGGSKGWKVAMIVWKGQSNLDEMNTVHIGFHHRIVILWLSECWMRLKDDTRKLCVYRDERKEPNHPTDQLEFYFEIVGPNWSCHHNITWHGHLCISFPISLSKSNKTGLQLHIFIVLL